MRTRRMNRLGRIERISGGVSANNLAANFTLSDTTPVFGASTVETLTYTGPIVPTSIQWQYSLDNAAWVDLDNSYPTTTVNVDDFGGPMTVWFRVTASKTGYSNSTSLSKSITILPAAPVANFTLSTYKGVAGGGTMLTLTDASTNTPTSWLYEYDAGSGWNALPGVSTDQNPVLNLDDISTDVVTISFRLTATNAGGNNTKTKLSSFVLLSTPLPDGTTVTLPAGTYTAVARGGTGGGGGGGTARSGGGSAGSGYVTGTLTLAAAADLTVGSPTGGTGGAADTDGTEASGTGTTMSIAGGILTIEAKNGGAGLAGVNGGTGGTCATSTASGTGLSSITKKVGGGGAAGAIAGDGGGGGGAATAAANGATATDINGGLDGGGNPSGGDGGEPSVSGSLPAASFGGAGGGGFDAMTGGSGGDGSNGFASLA